MNGEEALGGGKESDGERRWIGGLEGEKKEAGWVMMGC